MLVPASVIWRVARAEPCRAQTPHRVPGTPGRLGLVPARDEPRESRSLSPVGASTARRSGTPRRSRTRARSRRAARVAACLRPVVASRRSRRRVRTRARSRRAARVAACLRPVGRAPGVPGRRRTRARSRRASRVAACLRPVGRRQRTKCVGAPDRTRTCGPQLRRLMLYPAELRARRYDCKPRAPA